MVTVDDLWSPKMTVGLEYIDEHHRNLLKLLLDYKEVIALNLGIEKIKEVLNALISYTKYHFLAEERLMVKYKFPDMAAHKEEHRKFVEKLDEAFLNLNVNSVAHIAKDLFEFLKDWLIDHIIKKDTLISQHAKQA